jgi:pSer/pThr/pTyr-binding forkhead associated (FHA) protein
MYGELIPQGGGDIIPLIKETLLIGRRESCDIVLRYQNVSSNHCRLTLVNGYWYVEDLNSSNGTRLNSNRVSSKQRIDPGDILAVAKLKFSVSYDPSKLGAMGPPPMEDDDLGSIMNRSLLDKAGLSRKAGPTQRYNPLDDTPGQMKEKRRPND